MAAVAIPAVAAYGTWKSPISADLLVADSISFGQIAVDGDDTYWSEMRPQEGGRYVIVRRGKDGSCHDVTPEGTNARTRVHEYGGGAFLVKDGRVVFSNFADQKLYVVDAQGVPQALTEEGCRYADGVVDHLRDRLIYVREDHRKSESEPVNSIVAVSPDGSGQDGVLVEGHDFYSTPRISPDGKRLVWVAWNHPAMPWTDSELWMAEIEPDGKVFDARRLAGGEHVSIFQPEWSPGGALYFVSDSSGWWNLYRWAESEAVAVLPMTAEFGRPQWVFGMPTYGFVEEDRLICSYTRDGVWRLAEVHLGDGSWADLDLPYTSISSVHACSGRVVLLAGSPTAVNAVVELDLESCALTSLRRASSLEIEARYLSQPQPLEFPTSDGLSAHAIYYPPNNGDFRGPEEERPPLLVMSHGGPTAATSSVLDLSIQYWTSRGIAVLDVNYGGSTGYGRDYQDRLNGQWGVVDVADCSNGALHLVKEAKVDGGRLLIRGGSAGGYTTLAALTFKDLFRAGASYFGVSDLAALAQDTHKFESRYLDGLIGPYPERRDLYEERSPIHHVAGLSCPIIFFQGLEDKVVPPKQAEIMVDALRQKQVPVAYIAFEGEQHGFRQAKNIVRALEAELYFYARILGFRAADAIEPVEIENLPTS